MKRYLLLLALALQPAAAQAEMSLAQAQAYLESRKQAYSACETDTDCVIATDACGHSVAINSAQQFSYSEASRVYGRVVDCKAPEANPVTPVCENHACQAKDQ